MSSLTAAMRDLWGNPTPYGDGDFPSEHPVLLTLLWTVASIAVFAPLGVRRYRATSR